MLPTYSDPAEIGFAICDRDNNFTYGGKTWHAAHTFVGRDWVQLEINAATGLIEIWPRGHDGLKWAITRHAFLTGVGLVSMGNLDALAPTDLIAWFPKNHPGLNFAISKAAFFWGVELAKAAMDEADGRSA